MGRLERRLDALERAIPVRASDTSQGVGLPYFDLLTGEEKCGVSAWIFGQERSWEPRRPDNYFAGLLYRAMHGVDMPEGYDWLNEMLGGEIPKGRKNDRIHHTVGQTRGTAFDAGNAQRNA